MKLKHQSCALCRVRYVIMHTCGMADVRNQINGQDHIPLAI